MKLIAIALITFGLAAFSANADEKNQSAKKELTAKPAKVVTVKAPFENHWDANTWEKGSSENFWTAKTPAKQGK